MNLKGVIIMHTRMIDLLSQIAIVFPAFLAVFTFRGFFRAFVAKWMGDDTAYQEGFVSLNPLAHVDVAGLSIILLVMFVLGGLLVGVLDRRMLYIFIVFLGVRWAYPVPFEPRNFRNYKQGAILTILAGPIGCFLVALIFMYVHRFLPFRSMSIGVAKSLIEITSTTTMLGVYFGVLAFLPVPPFDGGRLLQFALPYLKQGIVTWLETYSFFIVLALFVLPGVSDAFFGFINSVSFVVVTLLSKLVF